MPAPTPTLITPFSLSLLNGADATLVTLEVVNDLPPDSERNYKLAQGYQQDAGVALGDGRVVLREFDIEVILEPLVALGGTDADLPEARAALVAHMLNTRKLRVTNSAGVRSLPVALGSSVSSPKRWANGKQRVSLTFIPSTITSTSDTVDDGDWLT